VTLPQRRPASRSLVAESIAAELDGLLALADRARASAYPGDRPGRQPVHTAYVPADAYRPGLAAEWGRRAAAELASRLPGDAEFAEVMGVAPALAGDLRARVLAKLAAEPVEDLRLDFEDGYRAREAAAEDADARAAGAALARAAADGVAPPFTGVRCRSLEPGTRRRSIVLLDEFLGSLLASGPLPAGFVVTLPKVTAAAQVTAMARLCERLEQAHHLADGELRFEIQVETPQVILGADGAAELARCVHAARGRLTGLHYGTYDYSAALGIAAAYQSMEHPVADFARAVMQVAVAGTGVRLSDGSSNVLPEGGSQQVLAAWRLHARLVRRSLEHGFYQGWDLHPAQLVSRYAATFGFFREGLAQACERLRAILRAGRREPRDRGVPGEPEDSGHAAIMEEPATARALAGFVGRGLDCGALTEAELAGSTGLDRVRLDALRQADMPAR